jgi:cytosine/adenosine deaminase-related metal-dependent hydrolase
MRLQMSGISGIMAQWLVVSSEKVLQDHGFLFDEKGVITAVLPNAQLIGKKGVKDARDSIVCPSFVNTHTHMYESMKHGALWPALSLKPLLEQFWWPCAENRQTAATLRLTAAHASINHLKTGVTLVNDIAEAPLAEAGTRLSGPAEVLKKIGGKGVLSLESNERISHDNGMTCLRENYDFTKAHMGDPDIRGTICTHTTFSAEVPFLKTAASMARELGATLQCHMNEGPDEGKFCFDKYGKTTAELYQEIGYWGPDVKAFANQCVCMDPVELEIMSKFGVGISTQPLSNAIWGNGIAPVADMLRYGINVGIGSDDGEGNYFELMRLVILLQRGRRMNGGLMPETAVFKMATEMGARAIGFSDVGTLEPGMKADFVVLTDDSPIRLKQRHIVSEIIWFKNPCDVKAVYVNGMCVLDGDGTVNIDDKAVLAEFKEANYEFWKGQAYQDY